MNTVMSEVVQGASQDPECGGRLASLEWRQINAVTLP